MESNPTPLKKLLLFILTTICFVSCIPIRIAPRIEDYKITKGKKFKRGLPKKTVFVFEDPKEANEFYSYVNTKFTLNDYYVEVEVPFQVDDKTFYFSFYEVEIPTKTINLIPLLIDGILSEAADMEPILEDAHSSRNGNWYIAIEVFSKTDKDCLREDSVSRELVLPYLQRLKQEYLSTHNYHEVVFKN